MFNHVLALFVFLVSGFLAELIYCKITNEKQSPFAMIVRIILCCVLTLIMRIFVTYAMGNDGPATANFFVTSEDIVKYLLLSIVCGILFPLICILFEKGILLRIRAKTLSNNEEIAPATPSSPKRKPS